MLNRSKIIIYLMILSLIFLLLSGCGLQKASSLKMSSASKPTVINASYATRPINVPAIVALDQQLFEKEYKKEGMEFKWTEIGAGPAQLEALASKSIDISTSMNYVSAILAKANGADIKVIAGYSQFPKAIGIVGRADLGMKSIADLKNKKIALQKGTMLHEFLMKVLEKEGMGVNDLEIIAMESTDAVPAILSGQIDAAILPEPLLSKVLASKKANIIQTAEGFISGQTFIVARGQFVRDNPELVKKFIKIHEESIEWAENNKDEFYSIASKQLNLDPSGIKALYPKFIFKTQIDESVIKELKESAQFLQNNGFLKPSVDINQLLKDLLDVSFI